MSSRVTMRDVARALGVDPSTVSLALRAHPKIPAETREKIRRAAEKLGYAPDPMLGALASYRRSSRQKGIVAELAWVNRWSPPERYHAFREFDAYWRGAEAAAREAGYRLERFNLGDAPLARFGRVLRARGIRGLLVPPHHGARNEWDGLELDGLAVVRIGHSVRLPVHAAGCDQTEAGRIGYASIHARGYRRLGFVTHPGAEFSSRFRAGFLFAQENTPSAQVLPTLVLDETGGDRDREALGRWVRTHRPEAIFTTHGGLRRMLEELGLRVPGDLALAATSVLDGNADAGIDQRPEEIGRAAAEILDGQLARGRFGVPAIPRMTTVHPRWRDGASLPNLSAPRSTG